MAGARGRVGGEGGEEAPAGPDEVRARVLETALRISAVLGGIAWVPGAWHAAITGAVGVAVIGTLLYGWAVFLLFTRMFSVAARGAAILVPVFLHGALVLFRIGPFSLGLVWMFGMVVLGAALYPRRYANLGIIAYTTVLVIAGIALHAGLLPWSSDRAADTRHWWVLSTMLVCLSVIVVPAISQLFRGLEESLRHTNAVSAELDAERKRLLETNTELERAIRGRQRAEATSARLAAAVEHAGSLILVFDPQWRIEYVNGAFERVTGFRRDEVVGQPVDVAGGMGTDGETRAAVRGAVEHGGTWRGRVRNRRRDGTEYEAETTVSAILDTAGRHASTVAVLHDISREAALEAQLRQAQKLEAIGTLAGGIAHDFNNLLVPIIGCTEAVRERMPETDEAHQLLGDVMSAAERAKDLVAQILAFSRKAEPRREARPVAPVIREAARLLRAMLPAGIRIEEQIADDAGEVRADATELHQVVMNLATNAYHAMRRSGGILSLAVDAVEPDELPANAEPHQAAGYVRITVGDTGIGMDAHTLERVFDPFFTTKAAGEGTGLGLAMVHGTVAALGGAIDVRSWPGAGTIVRIFLPRSPALPAAAAGVHETPAPHAETLHVLLVDDEAAVRRVAHRMLERGGFRVTATASAEEALARFRARPELFDAILTDFNMPGMTGLELARAIRSVDAETPIILTSGYVDSDALGAAAEYGVHRIVHKPFSPSEIAAAVSAAVPRG